MPKTQTVTLRYRASEAFWEIQCRAICELSICERRAYSLPSLLAHVAEKKLGELGKLTPKDLLYFASTDRSEEHTSELQSLMRISYAVFCLKKQKNRINI